MPAAAAATLDGLCRAGRGVLRQKAGLLDALIAAFGPSRARALYGRPCRLVGASVGQHVRHSLDHLDRAIAAAAAAVARYPAGPVPGATAAAIHYDLRRRGGPDEADPDAARARIDGLDRALRALPGQMDSGDGAGPSPAFDRVEACFMLAGDDDTEHRLPSTVARELGFAVHHAIHHLAIVRIIAEAEGLGLDLPDDFGKAPSTINYQRTHS